jgi:hypothetical protein
MQTLFGPLEAWNNGVVRQVQPGVADVDFHLDDGPVFRDGFSPTGQHLLFRAFDINFNIVQPVQITVAKSGAARALQRAQGSPPSGGTGCNLPAASAPGLSIATSSRFPMPDCHEWRDISLKARLSQRHFDCR